MFIPPIVSFPPGGYLRCLRSNSNVVKIKVAAKSTYIGNEASEQSEHLLKGSYQNFAQNTNFLLVFLDNVHIYHPGQHTAKTHRYAPKLVFICLMHGGGGSLKVWIAYIWYSYSARFAKTNILNTIPIYHIRSGTKEQIYLIFNICILGDLLIYLFRFIHIWSRIWYSCYTVHSCVGQTWP